MTEIKLHMGDLREGDGVIQAWSGAVWISLSPIPTGMAYEEAALRLCAPADMTEAEIQGQLARSRS